MSGGREANELESSCSASGALKIGGRAVEKPVAFTGVSVEQIGVGAFYYIASTAVIGVANYAGLEWTNGEIALFFTLTACVMLVALLLAVVSSSIRDELADQQGAPLMVIVLMAMVCAGLSMFEALNLLFYATAVLIGFVCALLVLSWGRTLSRMPVRKDIFAVPMSLVVATVCYLIYRAFSFFSLASANGWHVTVGVVGMLALLLAYSPEYKEVDSETGTANSFMLLGCVSAVFATGSGLLAFVAGFPGAGEHAPYTPYFLCEVVGILVLVVLCMGGSRLLRCGRLQSAGFARVLAALALALLAGLGAVSGVLLTENSGNGILWEASVWVLVVAALALGMRTSLFLVDGIVLGVLFSAWCFGQSVAIAVSFADFSWALPVAFTATLVFLGSLLRLADRPDGYQLVSEVARATAPVKEALLLEAIPPLPADEELSDRASEPEISFAETCLQIGEEYRLTTREIEVLRLVAEGRSARFIAEELVISYNTARSHMRNVYEKLGIHAKQEVISLVQSWN